MSFLKQSIFMLSRRMMSTNADEVLFEVKNNVGIITLNRPRVLNSLNENMVKLIYKQLKDWETTCSLVIVKGAGEKAFCAGGDVVAATRAGPAGVSFFRHEYLMNYTIGMYRIPYISLLDGITMGGGVGISVHGPYRIATEKTLFAMPETAIGLFPDVGGSYFLPKLKGKLGLYLGLTGYRLQGVDVAKAGVATHYINSQEIPHLEDKLIKLDLSSSSIEEVLNANTVDLSGYDFSLAPYLDSIDSCFSGKSMEEIVHLLNEDGTTWSKNVLGLLAAVSPTSLKITKKELDLGARENLRNCLITEFRLAAAALNKTASGDFYEGVRALLIDKDKKPKWNPATISEVNDELVNKCFDPLSNSEELGI